MLFITCITSLGDFLGSPRTDHMKMIFWYLKLNYVDIVVVAYFFYNPFWYLSVRLTEHFMPIFRYPQKMIY